jgi:hypothetical protein
VQAALAGGSDVHTGALADGFESFEDGDGRRAVVVLLSGHGPRCLLAVAMRWVTASMAKRTLTAVGCDTGSVWSAAPVLSSRPGAGPGVSLILLVPLN